MATACTSTQAAWASLRRASTWAARRSGRVTKCWVTGTLGDHGITIMSCREGLSFSADLESDAAPLNHLIAEVLAAAPDARCFRDPTRGGLASTLNELAAQSNNRHHGGGGRRAREARRAGRVRHAGLRRAAGCQRGQDGVRGARRPRPKRRLRPCARTVTGQKPPSSARWPPPGPDRGPKVFLRTAFGGTRILDMLVGEQLPRIC